MSRAMSDDQDGWNDSWYGKGIQVSTTYTIDGKSTLLELDRLMLTIGVPEGAANPK